jgi:hypothetical protein
MARPFRQARSPIPHPRPAAVTLADANRELLRHIADHADLLDVTTIGGLDPEDGVECLTPDGAGGYVKSILPAETVRWIVVPVTVDMLDQLATFEADAEDLEPNGDEEDGGDREPNISSPERWCGPDGKAELMTASEWRARP